MSAGFRNNLFMCKRNLTIAGLAGASIGSLVIKGEFPSALWVATWSLMASAGTGLFCWSIPSDCLGMMLSLAPMVVGVLASLLPHLRHLIEASDVNNTLENADVISLTWFLDPFILGSHSITSYLMGFHETRTGIDVVQEAAAADAPGPEEVDDLEEATDPAPLDASETFYRSNRRLA